LLAQAKTENEAREAAAARGFSKLHPMAISTHWRQGCSMTAPDAPEQCAECTRSMVAALEEALRERNFIKD
jgi:hypothetical protein